MCTPLDAFEGADINEGKKILATEATAEAARKTFEEGHVAAADLPVYHVAAAELSAGIPVFRLLAESGLVKTNGEARRLVRGGGARVNTIPVTDENQLVTQADAVEGAIRLSSGKKHHILVKAKA